MTDSKRTHRVVETPKVHGRYLSDYMAASERRRRTIIRDCKYRAIARIVQHDRAKAFITNMLKEGHPTAEKLSTEAQRLAEMMADTPFEREVLDNNSDFLAAFGDAFDMGQFPDGQIVEGPTQFKVSLNGVDVNPDIRLATRRVNKNNRERTGLLTIRYAKGKPLDEEVGRWHSALLFGCRKLIDSADESAPEQKLCVTLDAQSGRFIPAPGDALSRFKNMEAACASIAERWDSVEPPSNAVL